MNNKQITEHRVDICQNLFLKIIDDSLKKNLGVYFSAQKSVML